MPNRNEVIGRIKREFEKDGLGAAADRWFKDLRELDDPRLEMEETACQFARARWEPDFPRQTQFERLMRKCTIDTILLIAALHRMDVDAEAVVARAEAENLPLGLTVIEGGGGGSPPPASGAA